MIQNIQMRMITGEYEGANIPIANGDMVTIGRNPQQSQLLFKDEMVSRKHCSIHYDNQRDELILTNYSKSGTYVNGQRFDMEGFTIALKLGDTVRLGKSNNEFRIGYDTAPLVKKKRSKKLIIGSCCGVALVIACIVFIIFACSNEEKSDVETIIQDDSDIQKENSTVQDDSTYVEDEKITEENEKTIKETTEDTTEEITEESRTEVNDTEIITEEETESANNTENVQGMTFSEAAHNEDCYYYIESGNLYYPLSGGICDRKDGFSSSEAIYITKNNEPQIQKIHVGERIISFRHGIFSIQRMLAESGYTIPAYFNYSDNGTIKFDSFGGDCITTKNIVTINSAPTDMFDDYLEIGSYYFLSYPEPTDITVTYYEDYEEKCDNVFVSSRYYLKDCDISFENEDAVEGYIYFEIGENTKPGIYVVLFFNEYYLFEVVS